MTREARLARRRELHQQRRDVVNARRRRRYREQKVVPCRQCREATVRRGASFWCEGCRAYAPDDLRIWLTPEEAERRRLARNAKRKRTPKHLRGKPGRGKRCGAGLHNAPGVTP